MVGDRAVELVRPGLAEVDADLAGVAGLHVALDLRLAARSLDLDVVDLLAVVGHLERDLARLHGRVVGVELEVGRGQVDGLAPTPGGGRLLGGRRRRGAFALVVVTAARGETERCGDYEHGDAAPARDRALTSGSCGPEHGQRASFRGLPLPGVTTQRRVGIARTRSNPHAPPTRSSSCGQYPSRSLTKPCSPGSPPATPRPPPRSCAASRPASSGLPARSSGTRPRRRRSPRRRCCERGATLAHTTADAAAWRRGCWRSRATWRSTI